MTTARDIIKKALQKNGVLTKNESPSGDEASDGLDSLNAMLSSWSNDTLLLYTRTLENFPLTANVTEYTIGAGGTFNTDVPLQIVSAYVRSGGIDYPLSIVSDTDFDNYTTDKDLSGFTPNKMFYNRSYPLGKITIWPTPISGTNLYIRSEKELSQFLLDDVVELPAGWERALIFNLAVELASEYGQQSDQLTFQIAQESKKMLKKSVMRNRPMDTPPLINSNYFDIDTGDYS